MKIVHVANFYGPNSGGIKTTMHELGKGYLQMGHEFIYVVPGTQNLKESTPYGQKISLPSRILPGSGSYRMLRSRRDVIKLLDEIKPDRLEVSDRLTLTYIGNYAREKKIPVVVFSHETLKGLVERFLPRVAPRKAIVKWHNGRLSRHFDHVIATTEYAASEFRDIGISNLVKVPLGVDLENFSPTHRSMALREELLKGAKVLLVYCGRLSPEKEPQRAIETLIVLRERGIDARLIIVGTGPLWKKLRKLADGLPVDTLGYIADRKRVAGILSSADVSIAPGPVETFCLSALESISSGTPVVASNTSAVGEFLHLDQENPAGAIAANNGVAFADAVMDLLDRPQVREAARAAAESLPWDETIRLMMALHGIEGIGNLAPSAITKRKLTVA
jgi:alpha-1,6-mannosyltransferase